LKMASPPWKEIEMQLNATGYDRDTQSLVKTLRQPYGKLFHYDQPWSLAKLTSICDENQVTLPEESEG
ncbi:MAG TPA: hypothetical protein PLK82_04415, partial [Bacteroidales bacterium]|nr:hypothetical protein [Bacteroidales bacterium]